MYPGPKYAYSSHLFWFRNAITNSTVTVSKKLLPQQLSFDFTFAQDMELWMKLARTGLNCEYCPDATTLYRISPHSLSGNKVFAAKRHWRNLTKVQPNLPPRIANFLFYAVESSVVFLARRVPWITLPSNNEYLKALEREANVVANSRGIKEQS
jgi:hypothetical protein